MKKLFGVLAGLLLMVNFFTSCGKEEKTNRMIKVIVTDKETGEVLPDVTLILQGLELQAITNQDGCPDTFDQTYILKAQKEGYKEYIKEGIRPIDFHTKPLTIELVGEPFNPKEPELQEDYTETLLNMNLDMVYVSGGVFLMGGRGANADSVEKPIRKIKLDGYHIGKYEVTQAQWQAIMGTSVREQQDKTNPSWPLRGEGDNYPMYYVGWDEAQEFCQKLSEVTGKKYMLPTEAQWEYAARGGSKRQNYKYAGSDDINEVAWYSKNSDSKTHPVGTKKANGLGIYDMSGNVEEWCSDGYRKYKEVNTANPQEIADGQKYVVRGGSWYSRDKICRVSNRTYGDIGYRLGSLGFRVVCISE